MGNQKHYSGVHHVLGLHVEFVKFSPSCSSFYFPIDSFNSITFSIASFSLLLLHIHTIEFLYMSPSFLLLIKVIHTRR